MFAEDDIEHRKAQREAADVLYNDALTALDQALPKLPEFPHPPVAYDATKLTAVNEHWQILEGQPVEASSGWRRKLAQVVWAIVRPVFERQQTFNSALVDHLNRNVAVHHAHREATAAILGTLRGELEKIETFHARLILYLQTITLYVDTKDRSEQFATLVNLMTSGLNNLSDEFWRQFEAMTIQFERDRNAISNEYDRRFESMVAREQRYVSAVDELRTSISTVQQTGLTLKRELERLLPHGAPAPVPGPTQPGGQSPAASAAAAASAATAQSAEFTGNLNAYKYVGFENKFRGSQTDIRERLLEYGKIFDGASDVLDLGCGRGEFLAVLGERGISAHGLDINHEMVEICRARDLTVHEGDAVAYLNSLPDGSLGGLFAAQVVEHFPPPYLLQFLDTAYHKLRPGSAIVLETLNPSCWFAFFEAYIRDITHAWPLHPDTLKYLVVASGFQRVELRFLSPYPGDAKLQHCHVPSEANTPGMVSLVQTFNENVDKINALMFSYLDYAVVARRL
jgi:SAM-dependent methyltransferase